MDYNTSKKQDFKGRSKNLLILLAIIIFPGLIVFAQQETGQLNGTVTDPNGGVIANASVTVKNINNARTLTVQTDSQGQYIVTNLQPGNYEITVSSQSFQN